MIAHANGAHARIKSDLGSPTIAAFDFDGTLTNQHTFWRYLRFVAGSVRFHKAMAELSPMLARVVAGKLPVMTARAHLLERLLAGLSHERETELAEDYARNHLPLCLRKSAMERLCWHQRAGHRTAIVSNSAESYLKPLGRELGIDVVLGTRFEVVSGFLTGRVLGNDCVGGEKVARLRATFPELTSCRLSAYGDSYGDHELLAIADQPYYRAFQ